MLACAEAGQKVARPSTDEFAPSRFSNWRNSAPTGSPSQKRRFLNEDCQEGTEVEAKAGDGDDSGWAAVLLVLLAAAGPHYPALT